MSSLFPLQLAAVLAVDILVGDPRWWLHPIRLLGRLCEIVEKTVRTLAPFLPLRLGGLLGWLVVVSGAVTVVLLLIFVAELLVEPAGDAVALLVLYFSVAAGDLLKHGRRVEHQLGSGTIVGARQAVAMMVGRETATMSSTEVARACIESVAENLVDGITAPLFWATIAAATALATGGEPLLWATVGATSYKAINTMDSMWGYRNERYLHFGWFAARADDGANYLPARLSAWVLIATAVLLGYDGPGARRVYLRDRGKSPSPNSAHTEAAAAGALGVQLGGESRYFGVVQQKPLLGGGLRVPGAEDIHRCLRLIIASAVAFLLSMAFLYWLVDGIRWP